MTSTSARFTKLTNFALDSARMFLDRIAVPVPMDTKLDSIQEAAKVKVYLNHNCSMIEEDWLKMSLILVENASADIDECKETPGVCRDRNDICTNLRGSYRCIPINCPYGYMRDPDRKQ